MNHLELLTQRYPALAVCEDALRAACEAVIACYTAGGKLLMCGNGGSCADSDHIAGELLKGFLKMRPLSDEQIAGMQEKCPALDTETAKKLQGGLPAIPLTAMAALFTAFCNDVDPALVYAQQVLAMGKPGDVFIGISTSGNATNVAAAAKVAKAQGLTVIGLTGEKGGALRELADICIRVPETETYKVQELHLPVYHCLCATVEEHFFAE